MPNEMMMPPPLGAMPPPPFTNDGQFIPPFISGLDLTESQQDKIFEVMHSQEPAMPEQHKAARKIIEEMNRLASSDHYNLAEAIADTLVQHAATEAKLLALLIPEQRKQASEMRASLETHSGRNGNPPQ